MLIDVTNLDYRELNDRLRQDCRDFTLAGCCGQRFMRGRHVRAKIITGRRAFPAMRLGAYLNGASITVRANAQDAVGDTMNEGKIVVCGSIGDAAGYAMRGGRIFVRGNAGYRAGIHMKAYGEKMPVMVIGGAAGSFLGEYQAGGDIVVLGLGVPDEKIVGHFPWHGYARRKNVSPLQLQRRKISRSGGLPMQPVSADMEELGNTLSNLQPVRSSIPKKCCPPRLP